MIDAPLVERIANHYDQYRNDPALLARLRDGFPQVRFTLCRDDEVGRARPVYAGSGFNLYLVGGDHCLALTSGFAGATGVVVAEMDDSDE